jgi:hypothetical protein
VNGRRLWALMRTKLAEDLNPLLLALAFVVALVPTTLALVSVREVHTVGIIRGDDLPELEASLRKAGFAVRSAEPGEGSDTANGLVVLRVESNGPLVRTIWTENPWDELRSTLASGLRMHAAAHETKRLLRARLMREAGLPPEADSPIRVGPFMPGDRISTELGEAAKGPGLGQALFDAAPSRAVSMTLGIAVSVVTAVCCLTLSLGRNSGRLEPLLASGVTPAEHVAAYAILVAGAAFAIAAPAVLAVTAGLAWHGLSPHWPGLWLAALAPAYAVALVGFPLAAMTRIRRRLWSDLAGAGSVAAVAAVAYLPRVAAIRGGGEGWIEAVPFHGLAVGLVSGETGFAPAAVSGVLTLAVGILGIALALRGLDARFYLRQDT